MKQTIINLLDFVLPASVKNSLFNLGFNLAQEQFEKFAYQYAFAPNQKLGLQDIAKRGFLPKTILDVGAYQGDWSLMMSDIWPGAKLVMVEANESKAKILERVCKRIGAEYYIAVLGAKDDQEVEFFVMENGSSVYEENSSIKRTIEKKRLQTLDSLLLPEMTVDFLKIDTQGYELEVLAGAQRALKTAEAILLEVSLLEINQSAPLMHEVLAFLAQHQFVAYEILEIHRRPLDFAMNQVDILFVKADSSLRINKFFL